LRTPEAFGGWPNERSPPLGFTGIRPPSDVAQSEAAQPLLPAGTIRVLVMKEFLASECVVHFDDVEVIRSYAGHFIGVARGLVPEPIEVSCFCRIKPSPSARPMQLIE